MSRIPKPTLDDSNDFIKQSIHRDPFSSFTADGEEWLDYSPTNNKTLRIDLLDSLDAYIKGSLFLGSPINTEISVAGDFDHPEDERQVRLYKFFHPMQEALPTLRTQLETELSDEHHEVVLSPPMTLFEKTFSVISGADFDNNPQDFKARLNHAIWAFYKEKSGNVYGDERTRLFRYVRGQNNVIDNFFRTKEMTDDDICLAFHGFGGVSKIVDTVLSNALMALAAKYKQVPTHYFMRQCFHPDKGPFTLLYLSLPNRDHKEEIESYLIKRYLNKGGTCVHRPNLTNVTLPVYLKGFVQIEKLVKIEKRDGSAMRRTLHSN